MTESRENKQNKKMDEAENSPAISPATPAEDRMKESITEAKKTSSSAKRSREEMEQKKKQKKKFIRSEFDAKGATNALAFRMAWLSFDYPRLPLYPLTFVPTMSVRAYIDKYGSASYDLHTSKEENISLCGITMNEQISSPAMVVFDLFGFGPDKEASIKVILCKADMVEDEFERFHSSSYGSVMALGVSGYPGKCERGQLSIFAKSSTLLTAYPNPKVKSNPCWLAYEPLSEDVTELYQKILRDKEVNQTFRIRNKIVGYMISFLMEQYLFKAKPLIAKPFVNHHIVSFRALPRFSAWRELMIGGFSHAFEIGKIIRSKDINLALVQEIVTYTLYVDFDRNELMELTEKMLSGMVKKLTGSYKMKCHANGMDKDPVEIDFEPPFSRIDLLKELEKLSFPKTAAPKLNELVKHLSEKSVDPTFITFDPKIMGVLEKHHSLDSSLIEGFKLFINKHEAFNGFVALDDPVSCIQRILKIKDRQLTEEEERVLEYGLVPTGTWGIGMDQLAMLVTNSDSFEVLGRREVIKPEKS